MFQWTVPHTFLFKFPKNLNYLSGNSFLCSHFYEQTHFIPYTYIKTTMNDHTEGCYRQNSSCYHKYSVNLKTQRKKYHTINTVLISTYRNTQAKLGPSWSWSYGSWIDNYLCYQCLSQLNLWVWIPLMVRYTRYNVMW